MIISRVHTALEKLGTSCPMEGIAGLCPDLTWNQVSLAIDYLSHTGQILLMLDADRTYRVESSHFATPESSCVSASP
ncbi:MAG: hypothetical protein HP477_16110 [Nitrospira sp.]|nr:hypothetical protein [Nitrospira sp.]